MNKKLFRNQFNNTQQFFLNQKFKNDDAYDIFFRMCNVLKIG